MIYNLLLLLLHLLNINIIVIRHHYVTIHSRELMQSFPYLENSLNIIQVSLQSQ